MRKFIILIIVVVLFASMLGACEREHKREVDIVTDVLSSCIDTTLQWHKVTCTTVIIIGNHRDTSIDTYLTDTIWVPKVVQVQAEDTAVCREYYTQ